MTPARKDDGMDTQTVIAIFDGTDTAQQALETLQRLDREGWVKTMDAAVLVRGQDDKVTIHDTEDVDAPRGALACLRARSGAPRRLPRPAAAARPAGTRRRSGGIRRRRPSSARHP